MPKKIAVKLILQLHNKGMSQNAIAKSRHVSKHSISDVIEIATSRHISPLREVFSQIYHLLFELINKSIPSEI